MQWPLKNIRTSRLASACRKCHRAMCATIAAVFGWSVTGLEGDALDEYSIDPELTDWTE